jgi:hypothetical protein
MAAASTSASTGAAFEWLLQRQLEVGRDDV